MSEFPEASNCRDIAQQLIREDPGRNFNVIYGGGRKKFMSEKIIDEEGMRGQRTDGLDLIDEWLTTKDSPKAHYIHNAKELRTMNHSNIEHVLGLFEADHLQYHLTADADQPTLKELTRSAIEIMKKNPKGFVLFVEGGRIDHAHHENLARHALEETVEFSEAIRAATEITDEQDTLIVVTSDHAHTMTLSGYSQRGKDILGLNSEASDVDGMPYMTLSYANGPSGGNQRYHMKDDEMSEFIENFYAKKIFLNFLNFSESSEYRYPSMVPLNFETHGGDDVAIFARGPHSNLFSGVLEQNTIPHFIAYASCMGDGLTACNKRTDE
jgi:alkaline phosphatase